MPGLEITDIYTQIAYIVLEYTSKTDDATQVIDVKETRERLNDPRSKAAIEILKFAYNESDIDVLAMLLKRQRQYYEKTGNIHYLIDSQPKSQKAYIDLDRPKSSDKWKDLISKSIQSQVTMELDKTDIRDLLEIAKQLETMIAAPQDHARKLKHSFFNHIGESLDLDNIAITQPQIILDLLKKSWGDGGYDIAKFNQLNKAEREFFLQCDIFYQCVKYPQKTISRNEYILLKLIVPIMKKDSGLAIAIRAEQYDADAPASAWTMSHHGRGLDARLSVAGSENSTKLIVKDSKLHYFKVSDRSFPVARTDHAEYKGSKGQAGFIVTLDGNMQVFNHTGGAEAGDKHFHSMVTGGSSVLFAGSIQIIDGYINYITDTSGHYKPTYTLELLLFLSEKDLIHNNITYRIANKNYALIDKMFTDILDSTSGKASMRKYLKHQGLDGFYKVLKIKQDTARDPGQLAPFVLSTFIEYHDLLIPHIKPAYIGKEPWKSTLEEVIVEITKDDALDPIQALDIIDQIRGTGFDVESVQHDGKNCIEQIIGKLPLIQRMKAKALRAIKVKSFEHIHHHKAVKSDELQGSTPPQAAEAPNAQNDRQTIDPPRPL